MNARAPWVPDDHELDRVARSLEPAPPTAEQAEDNRTRLLAARLAVPQQRRRSAAPWVVSTGVALAAAAALIVWIAGRTQPSTPIEPVIAALTPARYETVTEWPDYVVRVDDGRVALRVPERTSPDRFRIKTADAQLEVHGSQVVIEVETGRLLTVVVETGWVELTRPGEPPVVVRAGESWRHSQIAVAPNVPRDPATDPAPPVQDRASVPPRATPVRPAMTRPTTSAPAIPTRSKPNQPPVQPAITAAVLASPSTATNPGEAEFRAGWSALRAGNAADAMKSFTAACTAARSSALGEDACFWTGVAAKRAGQAADARDALASFLRRFPHSARAPEASALLGWELYDRGELDAAEPYFRRAVDDKVPRVRDSAQKGLTAIARRRRTPAP